MRNVSDESILAQANQPDIPYYGCTQLMDVADSLSYTYDDYCAFAAACKRVPYTEAQYKSHRDSIRIIETHW